MKFVTRTCRKIFNRFAAVLAYLNRPVWTLPRCFQGHCKIPARDGWKWRSGSIPASRILWMLRERALCCLYRRKSETSALINIGDPTVAPCSFWTYIRRYTGKPSHMGILLIKKLKYDGDSLPDMFRVPEFKLTLLVPTFSLNWFNVSEHKQTGGCHRYRDPRDRQALQWRFRETTVVQLRSQSSVNSTAAWILTQWH